MAKSQHKTSMTVQENGRTVQTTIENFGATIPQPTIDPIDQALALEGIQYILAPELVPFADRVIHEHWETVFMDQWSNRRPTILFRFGAKVEKKNGTTAMATCRKVSGSSAWLYRQLDARGTHTSAAIYNLKHLEKLSESKAKHLTLPAHTHVVEGTPFFVITAWRHLWRSYLNDEQREALIFHELLHIVVKESEKEKSKGKKSYALRPHDLEEFAVVAKHYGTWDAATAIFKKALEERDDWEREQKFVPLEATITPTSDSSPTGNAKCAAHVVITRH
jgi:Putative phage metallopeptidase